MNNQMNEALQKAHASILDNELIKEFKKYESIVKNDQALVELENELKEMQKEIVNKKHYHEDVSTLIKDYESKKNTYFEHPIVVNYLNLKEEVNQYLQEITNIINVELEKG